MDFLNRKVYSQLYKHVFQPEMSVILGPRQAGKTTLMNHLALDLKNASRQSVYLNLDIVEDRQYFTSQHTLLSQIKKRTNQENAVIFLDEVHRLTNAGLFLKGLFDLNTGYKFIVSGSGSLELKANIIEPMTGRKKIFYCLPLSFTEYSANKLNISFSDVMKALNDNPYEKNRLENDYLFYGGYPRVVLAKTHEEKIDILTEIFKSYLEKDIQLILQVEKDIAFELLIKILASQVGNIINRAELASTCGINEKTINKYLDLLQKTYVINLVKPYYTNARKELTKSPKVYFLDLGFLTLARNKRQAGLWDGNVFENACFLRLVEKTPADTIYFWRTVGGAEIDFILPDQTESFVPCEAKLTAGKTDVIGKSLVSFIGKYHPKNVYIYTRENLNTFDRLGSQIHVLPYHYLPDQ